MVVWWLTYRSCIACSSASPRGSARAAAPAAANGSSSLQLTLAPTAPTSFLALCLDLELNLSIWASNQRIQSLREAVDCGHHRRGAAAPRRLPVSHHHPPPSAWATRSGWGRGGRHSSRGAADAVEEVELGRARSTREGGGGGPMREGVPARRGMEGEECGEAGRWVRVELSG
jgi:hypothetical protein